MAKKGVIVIGVDPKGIALVNSLMQAGIEGPEYASIVTDIRFKSRSRTAVKLVYRRYFGEWLRKASGKRADKAFIDALKTFIARCETIFVVTELRRKSDLNLLLQILDAAVDAEARRYVVLDLKADTFLSAGRFRSLSDLKGIDIRKNVPCGTKVVEYFTHREEIVADVMTEMVKAALVKGALANTPSAIAALIRKQWG